MTANLITHELVMVFMAQSPLCSVDRQTLCIKFCTNTSHSKSFFFKLFFLTAVESVSTVGNYKHWWNCLARGTKLNVWHPYFLNQSGDWNWWKYSHKFNYFCHLYAIKCNSHEEVRLVEASFKSHIWSESLSWFYLSFFLLYCTRVMLF